MKKYSKKIAVLAATFSGNKGAASMLESIIDNVTERYPEVQFNVLTVYPGEDKKQNPYKHVEIVSCTPKQMVFLAFPLSILYFLFRWLGPVKGLLLKNPVLKAFYECDLVVDATGISFVDSRGLIMNLYNFICIFVPLALKKKLIKFSQAMGPFNKFSNKLMAKMILPGIKTICARGDITMKHLMELHLKNVVLCADGAFVLPENEAAVKNIEKAVQNDDFFKKKVIGISISSVVYKYCQKAGIDYVGIMAEFAGYLTTQKDYNVLIFAQSAREGRQGLKNNDLPICQAVYEKVQNKINCKNLDKELAAREVREYISKCNMLVASRFHAMISALHKEIPVLLVGWSHKYKEVLDMFDLGKYAVDYKKLDLNTLMIEFEAFEADREKVAGKIRENLPKVKKSSMGNIDIIINAME